MSEYPYGNRYLAPMARPLHRCWRMRWVPSLAVAASLAVSGCGGESNSEGAAITVTFQVFDRGQNQACSAVSEITAVSATVFAADGIGKLPGYPKDADCAAGSVDLDLAPGEYVLEIVAIGRLGPQDGMPLFKSRGPLSVPNDDNREISLRPEVSRFELGWAFGDRMLEPCDDEVDSVVVLISVGQDPWYRATHDCRDTPLKIAALFAPRTYTLSVTAKSEQDYPVYRYEMPQILLPDENTFTAPLKAVGGQLRLDWEFAVGAMAGITSCNDPQVGISTMRLSVTTPLGDDPVNEEIGCVVSRPYAIRASRFTQGRPLIFEIIAEGVHRFRHAQAFTMPMGDHNLGLVTMQAVGSATVSWTIGAGSACAGVPLEQVGVVITDPNAMMGAPPILAAEAAPMSTQLAMPHVPYGDHDVTLIGVSNMTPVCNVTETRSITGRDNIWAPFQL